MTGDAAELVATLAARGLTVGTAESLTGGLVAAGIVDVPGSSAVLRGGIVAYDERIKRSLLGVDAELLAAHGAVHPEVARQMATGARRALRIGDDACDVGIATTGIAGPDSPDGQPVGTVHVAVATAAGVTVVTELLAGDRGAIRAATVALALRLAVDSVRATG